VDSWCHVLRWIGQLELLKTLVYVSTDCSTYDHGERYQFQNELNTSYGQTLTASETSRIFLDYFSHSSLVREKQCNLAMNFAIVKFIIAY